jgi:lipoate-protein ligase A
MADDEVLLHSAATGVASLRFYGWIEATVSLGYFQPASSIRDNSLLAKLPFVRRPTGGHTLVHHHELTYALALPASHVHAGGSWLIRMHDVIAQALRQLGIIVSQATATAPDPGEPVLCFRRFTAGDLLLEGHKIGGSAQRKQRQCLLQHGAILLASSPHAPQLKGIQELCGAQMPQEDLQKAIRDELARQTGWSIEGDDWTAAERGSREELAAGKYASAAWNEKR